jgi:diaminopimelate decarboxylase
MNWWENDYLNIKNQKLYLDEKEVTEVAEEYGTPLFIYSKRRILSNFKRLIQAFSDKTSLNLRIYYAMKANPNQDILRILRENGAYLDAVSPGEVDKALQAGYPKKKILYTGTSVSMDDISQVFKQEGIIVNIDAEEQLELMKEARDRWFKNKKILVSVRWNPGVGTGFSPKTVTAGIKSDSGMPIKFGVDEKRVIPVFQKAKGYGFIPAGLHQHIGSGWIREDFETVQWAVHKMIQMALKVESEGFSLEFLDFGGGFGPQYSPRQEIFPIKDYAECICREIEKSGLRIKTIAVEPGKYLVGDAGILLVKVEYLKKNYGNIFACVNAGTFNTVPRPAIYVEANHHIINCSELQSEKKAKITVAGNLCETGDVFGKEIEMPLPKRGDILAVLCAGAYCRSMASHFNLRNIPEEIII